MHFGRAFGLYALLRSIFRGPEALARNRVRATAHKQLARFLRRRGV